MLRHHADVSTTSEAAELLRHAVESEPVFSLSGERWHCTVSMGYSVMTRRQTNWKDLVIAADQALYAAKGVVLHAFLRMLFVREMHPHRHATSVP